MFLSLSRQCNERKSEELDENERDSNLCVEIEVYLSLLNNLV